MEVLLIAVGVSLAWYWYSGAKAREQVVMAARRACERHGVQLLDETVLLEKLRLRRRWDGRLAWRREYCFEFSDEGAQRHQGSLTLFSGRVTDLRLLLPDGTLIDTH